MLCCMVFRAVAWGKIQGGGGGKLGGWSLHSTILWQNEPFYNMYWKFQGGGEQLPPRRLRPWSWDNLRDISHKAMLQSQALRENKIII